MTGPAVSLPTPDDPIAVALRAAQAPHAPQAPQSGGFDPIAIALAHAQPSDPMADPMAKWHAAYKSGRLQKNITDQNAAEQGPSTLGAFGQSLAATGANLGSAVPGVPAAQMGLRSLIRPLVTGESAESLDQSLSDIEGAEGKIPGPLRVAEKFAGAAPAAALMPGSPMVASAAYGGLSGLLDAHNRSVPQAAGRAAVGTAVGATFGKLGDLLTTGARAVLPTWLGGAPELGQNVLDRTTRMRAADATNYGQAATEGAATGSTPAVAQALARPDIAPYAAVIRNSRTFAGADDNTVLREAYKLMSERQGTAGARLANATDFKAGTALEKSDIGLAQQELKTAAVTPSPGAPAPPTAHPMDPDALSSPAVRDASGTVTAGVTHSHAAEAAGGNPARLETGWTTADGRFITDHEADLQFGAHEQNALRNAGVLTTAPTEAGRMNSPGTPISMGEWADLFPQGPVATPAEAAAANAAKAARQSARRSPIESMNGLLAKNGPPAGPAGPASPVGPAAMPSFPGAVAAHAKAAGEIDALTQGADAANRAIRDASVSGSKLSKNSVAAYLQQAKGYTPEQAQAAAEGILGRLAGKVDLTVNPFKGFGIPKSMAAVSRVGHLLRATDQAAPPNSLLQLLRAGTVAGAGTAAAP